MTFPVVGSNIPSTYQISNSLRFNDGDSPTLSRTPGSAGNRKTWTFSYWIKRSTISTVQQTFAVGTNASTPWFLNYINSDDTLHVWFHDGTNSYFSTGLNKLRDTSAWYHIVYFVDTTQATASDRFKVYVNNVEVTWGSYNPPAQNFDTEVNTTSTHYIGRAGNGQYFDGYIAETYFIDGQALTPSNFGEFDEDSGVWKPKQYAGTYGTNGFYLKFNNTGNIGEDSSGNDNTWTPTNLSGTADVMLDTPTNNFATYNPLFNYGNESFSEGNLNLSTGTSGGSIGTIAVNTGKWYWEIRVGNSDSARHAGIAEISTAQTSLFTESVYYRSDAQKTINNVSSSYGTSFTTGDILGVALDVDNQTVTYYKNNSSQGSIDISSVYSIGDYVSFAMVQSGGINNIDFGNFGQDSSFAGNTTRQNNSDGNGYGDFYYAPPSGYLALCTQNLATALSPTIDDGSQYFNTKLYSGNSTTNPITGVGFAPDFTWLKARNYANAHFLLDTTRGSGQVLFSSSSTTETDYQGTRWQSFDSDGFTLTGSDSSTNISGGNYVTWNWKANGGTTSSNTDGSITSTVQTGGGGFSIVTYTGVNGSQSVGHSLGVAPKMIIAKNRTTSDVWLVYHHVLGQDNIRLNLTNATANQSPNPWSSTAPSSSVFYLDNSGGGWLNNTGDDYVAYCFAEIEGYSKFGSYTGNGSTDGTFVYTGFRPAFFIIKRTDSAGENWTMFDNKRDGYNVNNDMLKANNSETENDANVYGGSFDLLSNGFKVRESAARHNASGGTYIYMAFAENPFVTSGATPVIAR